MSRTSMGFYAAAAFNIVGISLVSHGFTNQDLFALHPGLFGVYGCLLVGIWGLAYASVATTFERVPALVAVFAIEKLFFGATWVMWWLQAERPTLDQLFATDPSSAAFTLGYGAGDLGFALFFGFTAWTSLRKHQA